MKNKTLAIVFFGSMLLASNATAGTVWLTGWDFESNNTRLLGFDEETGVQKHSIAGEGIVAADVCEKTGTAYFLDQFTLKAVDAHGNVSVIAENIGENLSGTPQVKVGQRYCTIWVYALGNQDMHIVRNPGATAQERIDTAAFDYIEAADVDDSNDDLWIGQYNGRVYRVSKKTGLRSWRIASQGDFTVRDIAVANGVVHILREDGLSGYLNTTRRDNPQQVYFDTTHQDYHDPAAALSAARIMANGTGDLVVNVLNFFFDNGFRTTSDAIRMTVDLENGALVSTNDHFVPFEDLQDAARSHAEFIAGDGRKLWVFNADNRLRLLDASGITLREIDYRQEHADIMAHNIAY